MKIIRVVFLSLALISTNTFSGEFDYCGPLATAATNLKAGIIGPAGAKSVFLLAIGGNVPNGVSVCSASVYGSNNDKDGNATKRLEACVNHSLKECVDDVKCPPGKEKRVAPNYNFNNNNRKGFIKGAPKPNPNNIHFVGDVVRVSCVDPNAAPAPVGMDRDGDGLDDGLDPCPNDIANMCYISNYEDETGYCGDGIVNDDEECDDGNTDDNDNCSNGCLTNYPESNTGTF